MKKSTILRFLITYLIILLPVLIVTVWITQDYIDNTRQAEISRLENQMSDSAALVTNYFADTSTKASVLFESNSYISKDVLTNPSVCFELISLLRSVNSFSSYSRNIFVWYGVDSLVTPSGTVTPDVYFTQELGCDAATSKKAQTVISGKNKSVVFLPNRANGGYFLFHSPIGEDGYGNYRSVQTLTGVTELGNMLRTTLRSENIVFCLQLGDEVCYFYNTHDGCKYLTAENADRLISGYSELYQTNETDVSGFKFRILCDLNEQLVEFYQMRNISIVLLCIGLFVSVLMSLALSFVRFSYFEGLANQIQRKVTVDLQKKRFVVAEMDYVQTLFNGYINENVSNHKRMVEYRRMLIKHISMLLLHGSMRNREEIESALKTCGAELNEEYFFVLGIEVENQQALDRLDVLLQGDIHSAVTNEGKKMMFIFCEISCNDATSEERHITANRLLSTLRSVEIPCLRLALSRVYRDICEVNYAYLESYNMIVNSSNSETNIIVWEDYVQIDGNNVTKIGSTYINEFRSAIAMCDAKLAEEVLTQAFNQKEIASSENSLSELMYTFSQLLIAEINTLAGMEVSDDIINEINNVDMTRKEKYIQTISRILQCYFSEKDAAAAFNRVLDFVEINYTKYNFSLEMVAEFADCSKSKISKMFRSRVGVTYLEYVTRLRMTKARELLEQTNMSVKDVFCAVGYLDITNASKKFQAYYGVKPSACRAKNKGNE